MTEVQDPTPSPQPPPPPLPPPSTVPDQASTTQQAAHHTASQAPGHHHSRPDQGQGQHGTRRERPSKFNSVAFVDVEQGGHLDLDTRPFASISPSSVLDFPVRLTDTDTSAEIHITSLIDKPSSFKIKCTTPSAYIVRPAMGFIHGKETITVVVTLLRERQQTIDTDKFLVAVTQVEDFYVDRYDKLNEIWKSVPKDPTRYIEVTLTCGMNVGIAPVRMPDEQTLLRNFQTQRGSHIGMVCVTMFPLLYAVIYSHLNQYNRGLHRTEQLGVQLTSFIRCQICLAIVVLLCAALIIYIYYFSKPLMTRTY